MADSSGGEDFLDSGAGPSRSTTGGQEDQTATEPKRKRFRPFRVVRKIFRRRSKHKNDDEAAKSRSTSELLTTGGTPRRSEIHDGTPISSALSLSHDSVFAPEAETRTSDRGREKERRDRPHSVRRRFSVKGMKEELMNKLRARQESDDEDPGLPRSPCTSPTTAEVLRQGLMDQSGKFRSSDGSLLSMGSSETDNEDGLFQSRMIFERRQSGDPDLDLGPTMLLNHRAAHHRIAVKPRKNHAVPRHRRLHQVTTGSSLPTTPEDVEEVSHSYKVPSSPKQRHFSALSKAVLEEPPPVAAGVAAADEGSPKHKTDFEGDSVVNNNNKSHAAERKLKHEIARYGQRMSKNDGVDSESRNPEPSVVTAPRVRSRTLEDSETTTTSCFGFGMRSKKDVAEVSEPISEANVAASKRDGEDEPFLSKLFGSRLSGRKKKSDEAKRDDNGSLEQQQQQQPKVQSFSTNSRSSPEKDSTSVIYNEKHSNRVFISVVQDSVPQYVPFRPSLSTASFGRAETQKDSRSFPSRGEVEEDIVASCKQSTSDICEPNYRRQVQKEKTQHLSIVTQDERKSNREESIHRYSFQVTANKEETSSFFRHETKDSEEGTQEEEPFESLNDSMDSSLDLSPNFESGSQLRASISDPKRMSVQHQLTKEDIDELELYHYSRSLPEPVTPYVAVRPLRFSLGSAKDAPLLNVARQHSDESVTEPLSIDELNSDVSFCNDSLATEAMAQPTIQSTSIDECCKTPERKLPIELKRPSSIEIRPYARLGHDDGFSYEESTTDVVRLDVSWEKKPQKPKVASQSDSELPVSLPEQLATSPIRDEVEKLKEKSPAPVVETESGAIVRSVPLRRPRQRQMGNKTEEPELFKVFHRRSLKLKDSDVPVVTQKENEEDGQSNFDTVKDETEKTPAIEKPDSPVTELSSVVATTVMEPTKTTVERTRGSSFSDRQVYISLSASRLSKSQDVDGVEDKTPQKTSVTSVVRKLSSVGSVFVPFAKREDQTKPVLDYNENLEPGSKCRTNSFQNNESTPSLPPTSTSIIESGNTVRSKEPQELDGGRVDWTAETLSSNNQESTSSRRGSNTSESAKLFGQRSFGVSRGSTVQGQTVSTKGTVTPDTVRTPLATEGVGGDEPKTPVSEDAENFSSSGVAIRQKPCDASSTKNQDVSLKSDRRTTAPLIIEANTKPSVGRTSKVLDLVRNFQKMQVS